MRVAAAIVAVLATLLLAPLPVAAAGDPALYRCTVIVTGQGEETRLPGLSRCLATVLAKVSGDARLVDDRGVTTLAAEAADLVAGFRYRDRMEGIPAHDEQGSRDRPYDLTVDFDPAAVDAALAKLGRKPWTAPRPAVAVLAMVTIGDRSFALARDGSLGRDMREALAAAAETSGLAVVLPTVAALAGAGPAAFTDRAARDRVMAAAGGAVGRAGRLDWSQAGLGWTASWGFEDAGVVHAWRVTGVSFDAAFRNGLAGLALVLSGNGTSD